MIQEILHEYITSRTIARLPGIQLSVPIHVDTPDADQKFRMSDAGRCRLYRFLKRQGQEIPMPAPNHLLTMEAGNVFHAWAALAVQDAGYLIDSEGVLEDDDRIGHFDILLEFDGALTLVDVKTVSSKKMWRMKKNRSGPDQHHIYQIITYWSGLVSEQIGDPILDDGELIDRTMICYISRDNWHEIIECDIDRRPLLLSQVQDDWDRLREAWHSHTAPAPNPAEWECRYCPYAPRCDGANT